MVKYRIRDNLSTLETITGSLMSLSGSATLVYGMFKQDQETAILGGVLLIYGALVETSNYVKAYLETRVRNMNDTEERERPSQIIKP